MRTHFAPGSQNVGGLKVTYIKRKRWNKIILVIFQKNEEVLIRGYDEVTNYILFILTFAADHLKKIKLRSFVKYDLYNFLNYN